MELLTFHPRRRLAAGGLLLAALVAGCGSDDAAGTRRDAGRAASAGAAAAATPAASRPRVVFLGDSLTAGLGLSQAQSYPSLIAARLDRDGAGVEVVNAGISGDTAAGGRRRMNWALEGDVRVLVLGLGANDGLRGTPVGSMKENLQAIIRDAKSRGITVLLLGMEAPPNFGPEYTAAFRAAFRDLAREEDVAFVPFFLDGVAGVPALNQPDGLHPNADGAARVADVVWQALEPIVDEAVAR